MVCHFSARRNMQGARSTYSTGGVRKTENDTQIVPLFDFLHCFEALCLRLDVFTSAMSSKNTKTLSIHLRYVEVTVVKFLRFLFGFFTLVAFPCTILDIIRITIYICVCVIFCVSFSAGSLSTCNADCACDYVKYSPICGENGNTYISGCHAGCTERIKSDGTQVHKQVFRCGNAICESSLSLFPMHPNFPNRGYCNIHRELLLYTHIHAI